MGLLWIKPDPPVENPDPIGHDAQSAAEILNENSCTNSLTPSKCPSRPAGILHTNSTFLSEDVAQFCISVCGGCLLSFFFYSFDALELVVCVTGLSDFLLHKQ